MIYNTALVQSQDSTEFIGAVQKTVDGFQDDNLEVEIQYAVVPHAFTAFIIARKA